MCVHAKFVDQSEHEINILFTVRVMLLNNNLHDWLHAPGTATEIQLFIGLVAVKLIYLINIHESKLVTENEMNNLGLDTE